MAAPSRGDTERMADVDDETAFFKTPAALQRALDVGCAYLNRRERTVGEVRAQLERKGIPAEHVEPAVRTLIDQGLLSDERFAAMFVSDKRELEHWGTERIRRGLRARGIDRELAERALGAEEGSEEQRSELDRALELLRRRFPAPPVDRRERERALGALVRKGYESELALDALGAYAREVGEP